jgi:hypothetical protein
MTLSARHRWGYPVAYSEQGSLDCSPVPISQQMCDLGEVISQYASPFAQQQNVKSVACASQESWEDQL